MSGAGYPRKGNRIERELVELHRAFGIHAERYSLPGANRGHNIDIYPFGREEAPLVFEVKARKNDRKMGRRSPSSAHTETGGHRVQ